MKLAGWLVLVLASCSSGKLSVGTRDALPGLEPTNRATALPVGVVNVNNSPLKAAGYRALLRFVPDRALSIDRVYFGFNLRGASCAEAGSDGAGDGGLLDMSLVSIDAATGLPGASLEHEAVSACARYDEARAEAGSTPVLVWMNVRAELDAGKPYALIVQNAHRDPEQHYFSFHMPIAEVELSGPQARNELDPNAPGGVMSLDPREHVAWSEDAGRTWHYGASNGQYPSFVRDRPATRIPQYGFRLHDGSTLAPQPYYAYDTDCTGCRVVYANARDERRLGVLGGLAAPGSEVGTLTLGNLASGAESSCTPDPGDGPRTCMLDTPISVSVGDSYAISATGTVSLLRMDNAQRVMFPTVGTAQGELRAYQPDPAPGTNEKDVPSLWASPLSADAR